MLPRCCWLAPGIITQHHGGSALLCHALRAGAPAAAAAAAAWQRRGAASAAASSPPPPSQQQHGRGERVPLAHPCVAVWGANTGVGKTLVSAGLVAAAVRGGVATQFVKPVQTGYPRDSDARLVAAAATHAAGAAAVAAHLAEPQTLFGYLRPVSPHVAAAEEGRVAPDADVVARVAAALRDFAAERAAHASSSSSSSGSRPAAALSVVETAGGVASPGPSGTPQAELLRPLGLPALLVGDPALGGISTTLCAYDALLLRGHAPAAVVIMDDGGGGGNGGGGLGNAAAVAAQLRHAAVHRLGRPLPVVALPLCRPPPPDAPLSAGGDGHIDAALAAWLDDSRAHFDALLRLLQEQHAERLAWLRGAAQDAAARVWWPFTQHAQLARSGADVTVVDQRCGSDWLVFNEGGAGSSSGSSNGNNSSGGRAELVPLLDASSSWWTQTAASPGLQLEVARATAAAAGRLMHVMWPQIAHEPGLELTRLLLDGPLGAGWASRAFFSDDGSTAVEVALKLALRKYAAGRAPEVLLSGAHDDGIGDSGSSGGDSARGQQQQQPPRLEVLALANGYHGDTLGAMDCAAPSAFNGPRQSPWYRGRGRFLTPPYLALRRGRWRLDAPEWLQPAGEGGGGGGGEDEAAAPSWATRDEAFDLHARAGSPLERAYTRHVEAAIDAHEAACDPHTGRRRRLAVLLLEPVLQGAGGMLLVDPLFQAAAVRAARARGLVVVYDEVFAGCWRLGHGAAGPALLGERPDVACYAKLLTGGAAPLAVTLASAAVFDAFRGGGRAAALLHGHSYTAYPLGCAAAVASLRALQDPLLNPNLCAPEAAVATAPGAAGAAAATASGAAAAADGHTECRCARAAAAANAPPCAAPCGQVLPLWGEADAAALSMRPGVAGVVTIGSVLAVELAAARKGYAAGGGAAAVAVVAALRRRGVAARPLGAVVYAVLPPTTARATAAWLLEQVRGALDDAEAAGWRGGVEGQEEGVLI